MEPALDQQHRVKIPVRVMGLKLDLSPEQIAPLRKLDPFFLQGCSSANDSFLFCSGRYSRLDIRLRRQ